jgi:AcrR family transcriptional regulator
VLSPRELTCRRVGRIGRTARPRQGGQWTFASLRTALAVPQLPAGRLADLVPLDRTAGVSCARSLRRRWRRDKVEQLLRLFTQRITGATMAKAGPRTEAGGARAATRSADIRRALVTAALAALAEVGFAGASAREIAGRAGCSQGLVFYHYGSVNDLLLAALDEISARRMDAYRGLVDRATSVAGLIDAARSIFAEDLESGHVRVLVEMIAGAQSVPGLGERVAERLVPWREFAEAAIRKALAGSPAARLLPAADAAHAVVAGFLGLEMLAMLDGDTSAAMTVFGRARAFARLLDVLAGIKLPAGRRDSR